MGDFLESASIQATVTVDGNLVREALRTVIDPELGINIVDLGLVYSIQAAGPSAAIEMTMTTPACPMSTFLRDEARKAVQAAFPVLREVNVELVWAPAWKPEMMSDEAKLLLGWRSDERP